MRDAKVEHVRAGRPFAAEGETEWDGGLRVLLSGKLAAKCDETFLVTPFCSATRPIQPYSHLPEQN